MTPIITAVSGRAINAPPPIGKGDSTADDADTERFRTYGDRRALKDQSLSGMRDGLVSHLHCVTFARWGPGTPAETLHLRRSAAGGVVAGKPE